MLRMCTVSLLILAGVVIPGCADADALDAAERRAESAESKLKEVEARLSDLEGWGKNESSLAQEAEKRAKLAEKRVEELESEVRVAGARLKATERLAGQPGRYQVFMREGYRKDTFLVDTAEGQVWEPVTITDMEGQPVVWRPMERFDTKKEYDSWLIFGPKEK